MSAEEAISMLSSISIFKHRLLVDIKFYKDAFISLCYSVLSSNQTISIDSGHFYSAPSSPLLLRGAPDYSTDTVSEFHAEAHRQLQVKDLPKVTTWRLKRESNPRPSG